VFSIEMCGYWMWLSIIVFLLNSNYLIIGRCRVKEVAYKATHLTLWSTYLVRAKHTHRFPDVTFVRNIIIKNYTKASKLCSTRIATLEKNYKKHVYCFY
jgi:hypothetical protein